MSSSDFPSAATPAKISAMPPIAMTTAPMTKAIATAPLLPEAISLPKRRGPEMPPTAVPTA